MSESICLVCSTIDENCPRGLKRDDKDLTVSQCSFFEEYQEKQNLENSGVNLDFFKKLRESQEENIDFSKQKENSCKNPGAKHYELWNDFETIDVLKNCLTLDEFTGFLKGNILKYQLRLGKKDDVSKEIQKIKDYQRELNSILKEINVK
jgi:hypothetical protein